MNALDLSQAVFIQNQQIKTDSLKVAEAFGKRHTHILRAIELLDCPKEFTQPNFGLSDYIDSTGRVLPKYEMTKDGWMFLVMGFTGEKAAQIKIAFINAFNAMATLLQNQQITEQQGIAVGAKVRLNSGSPELTVNRLISNADGIVESVEVTWFSSRLYKSILSVQAITPTLMLQNDELEQFWQAIYRYGLTKLNHSKKPNLLAINLKQLSEYIENIPTRNDFAHLLMRSQKPYPQYLQHNKAVYSAITNKTVKCWVFEYNTQLQLTVEGV